MKTIVIFYSISGQTEFVANKLAEKLECETLKIQTLEIIKLNVISMYYGGTKAMMSNELPKLRPYAFNQDDYDNIIIGFPNWASNCPPAMKTFIAENKFVGKNIYLFTTYGARGGNACLENVAKNFGESQIKNTVKIFFQKENQRKSLKKQFRH